MSRRRKRAGLMLVVETRMEREVSACDSASNLTDWRFGMTKAGLIFESVKIDPGKSNELLQVFDKILAGLCKSDLFKESSMNGLERSLYSSLPMSVSGFEEVEHAKLTQLVSRPANRPFSDAMQSWQDAALEPVRL